MESHKVEFYQLTLFILFINDLVTDLPRGIKAALSADDLVLLCSEEHVTTVADRMQQAADQPTAWTNDCVQLKTEKSCTTLFTLSPKQKVGPRCVSNTL
jgi:hypothetical protein